MKLLLRAHQVVDRGDRHEDEADREQHLVEMAAGVEVAIERALEHARRSRRWTRKASGSAAKNGTPERLISTRADIAAGHREGAVGEVDEVHQPERDRQPAGQHEQQHAVGDAVEQDGEQRGHGMRTGDLSQAVIPGHAKHEPGISRCRVRIFDAPPG